MLKKSTHAKLAFLVANSLAVLWIFYRFEDQLAAAFIALGLLTFSLTLLNFIKKHFES